MFDKTGTLTKGRPRMTGMAAAAAAATGSISRGGAAAAEREVLRLATAVESTTSHPLAAVGTAEAEGDREAAMAHLPAAEGA